jgi:hypothetical protein
LKAVILDIVQAAYRFVEPNIGSDIVALARAMHVGPALTTVVELGAPLLQAAADATLPPVAAAVALAA